jgi:hypothetical protein
MKFPLCKVVKKEKSNSSSSSCEKVSIRINRIKMEGKNPIKRKHQQYNFKLPFFAFFRALNFNRKKIPAADERIIYADPFYVFPSNFLFLS